MKWQFVDQYTICLCLLDFETSNNHDNHNPCDIFSLGTLLSPSYFLFDTVIEWCYSMSGKLRVSSGRLPMESGTLPYVTVLDISLMHNSQMFSQEYYFMSLKRGFKRVLKRALKRALNCYPVMRYYQLSMD